MGKWEMVRLGEVLTDTITGEWGNECIDGDGVNVLRTTNFTNKGIVDFSNVVVRDISVEKVKKKKLLPHDIILEKSGGSDNQPVGRVVYFNNADGIFLCNNFTQILRINSQTAHSKYVFYHLFNLHRTGVTELLQNKTTGIRNLQVKSYMALPLPLPPLVIQEKIADVFDRANALIEKRKAQIAKLDLLVKSQFVEMFGDPVTNTLGWEVKKFADVSKVRQGLQIPISERHTVAGNNRFKYITVQYLNGSKTEEYIENPRPNVICDEGDVLMTRTGNTGLVVTGVKGVFHNNFFLIDFDRKSLIKTFLVYYLNTKWIQYELLRRAGSSTIPDLNHSEFYKIAVCLPPLSLQTQFATFVERVEAQKTQLKKSLELLELNYKSLMQKCFSGEII